MGGLTATANILKRDPGTPRNSEPDVGGLNRIFTKSPLIEHIQK